MRTLQKCGHRAKSFLFKRIVLRTAVLSALTLLPNCALVDETLAPRTSSVNASWDDYRNDSILLNIARASQSAPLQFVALAKYTGTNTLTAGSSAQISYAAADANGARTFGPLTAGTTGGNSVDLATLDKAPFYENLLTELSGRDIYLLQKQSESRSLLFNLVVESVRIKRPDGAAYDFRNDPSDNKYTHSENRV